MKALLHEPPLVVDRAYLDLVRSRLDAGGFTVFAFNGHEAGAMASGGWDGWCRRHGFDPRRAEAVWFDPAPNGDWSDVVLMLGVLRAGEL